jgi:hypothetical protein
MAPPKYNQQSTDFGKCYRISEPYSQQIKCNSEKLEGEEKKILKAN